jgi:dipeptidyl-peptidase-3
MCTISRAKRTHDIITVPRLEPTTVKAIAAITPETIQLWETIKDGLFPAAKVEQMHLGYPDAGHISTYYPESPNITKDEIAVISDFLESQKLLPENTRIKTTPSGYDVLIASAEQDPSSDSRDIQQSEWEISSIPGGDKLKGSKLVLTFGDYSKEMATISEAMSQAAKHALNETEKSMAEEYAKSFRTGSLQAYLQSQRFWIRDKKPEVETCIGFVETYRDPHGIRGEWEGFVAMVNKERTKAFGKLVDAAPSLIPKLPWDKSFEKDKFLSPDFTSLEVLTFAGSGIPAGINMRTMNSFSRSNS